MRRVGLLLAMAAVLVSSGSVASAKPARGPRFDELESLRSVAPCEHAPTWPKLRTCLARGAATVTVMYDLENAKLISVRGKQTSEAVSLYLFRSNEWRRAPLYATLNPSTEILSFKRMTKQTGYRMDQGTVMNSTAPIEPRAPMILRRTYTTVCFDNGSCRGVFSSCDALIAGKTYWLFHGKVVIDHGQVQVAGDKSLAGTICAPSPSAFMPVQSEDPGDPLE